MLLPAATLSTLKIRSLNCHNLVAVYVESLLESSLKVILLWNTWKNTGYSDLFFMLVLKSLNLTFFAYHYKLIQPVFIKWNVRPLLEQTWLK